MRQARRLRPLATVARLTVVGLFLTVTAFARKGGYNNNYHQPQGGYKLPMQHEVGSACLDKVDNDWDHSVDCDDEDCAPVCNLLGAYGHTFTEWRKEHTRRSWNPKNGVDPRTCFEPGGRWTRARCCFTYGGRFPKGNEKCWGGGYSFKLCCGDSEAHEEPWQCRDGIDNDHDGQYDCADPDCYKDPSCTEAYWEQGTSGSQNRASTSQMERLKKTCTNGKLQEVTSTKHHMCPKPDIHHLVPGSCPISCAKTFTPWYNDCRLLPVAIRANRLLKNGLEKFAQECAAKLVWVKRHRGNGELCTYGGCSAAAKKNGSCLSCRSGLRCAKVRPGLCRLWTGGGACPGVCRTYSGGGKLPVRVQNETRGKG